MGSRVRLIWWLAAIVALSLPAGWILLSPRGSARSAPAASADGRRPVRFLIGSPGGFDQHGFVQEYAASLPNVELVVVNSTRSGGFRLEELQVDEADLAINASQAVFLAFAGQLETVSEPFDRLRAVAALGIVPVHLVARAGSGIHSVADLRGRTASLGGQDSEHYRVAAAVLDAFGVDRASVRNTPMASEVAAARLQEGRLDAMLVVGGYPAEAVLAATAGGRGHLVPIDGPVADRLRARSGFLYPALVPAGTYENQPTTIRTLGIQNLLLTHRDVPEPVVYELTSQFFTALPKLATLVTSLRHMDVQGASATSIPLHDGAARYYRERELFR
jgi:TRAP transporter TAXI family solute receptor